MTMRTLAISGMVALAAALAATPALAQKKEATPQEILKKRNAEELDKGYSDAMKRTQATQSANDPWANVRPAEPQKPEGKKPRS